MPSGSHQNPERQTPDPLTSQGYPLGWVPSGPAQDPSVYGYGQVPASPQFVAPSYPNIGPSSATQYMAGYGTNPPRQPPVHPTHTYGTYPNYPSGYPGYVINRSHQHLG